MHRPLAAAPRPPVTGSPPRAGRPGGRARRVPPGARGGARRAPGGPGGRAAPAGAARPGSRTSSPPRPWRPASPSSSSSAAQPGDLRPWQELAERLWPAACRDIGAGRDRAPARLTLGQRRALLDFVAPRAGAPAPPEPDQAQQVRFAEIARALSVLARNVAARRGLIVALDDADRLSARGRELLGLFLAGLRDAPVGVALLGRGRGAADATARGRTSWRRRAPTRSACCSGRCPSRRSAAGCGRCAAARRPAEEIAADRAGDRRRAGADPRPGGSRAPAAGATPAGAARSRRPGWRPPRSPPLTWSSTPRSSPGCSTWPTRRPTARNATRAAWRGSTPRRASASPTAATATT